MKYSIRQKNATDDEDDPSCLAFYDKVYRQLSFINSSYSFDNRFAVPLYEWQAPPLIQRAIERIDGLRDKNLQMCEQKVLLSNTILPSRSVAEEIHKSFEYINWVFPVKDLYRMKKSIWAKYMERIMTKCNRIVAQMQLLNTWLSNLSDVGVFELTAGNSPIILSNKETRMANFVMYRPVMVNKYESRMLAMLKRIVEEPKKVESDVSLIEGEIVYKFDLAATAKYVKEHIEVEWGKLWSKLERTKDNFDDYELFMRIYSPWANELAANMRGVSTESSFLNLYREM